MTGFELRGAPPRVVGVVVAEMAMRHRRRRHVEVAKGELHERDVARRADHHLRLLHDVIRESLDPVRHLALVAARRQARQRRLHHPPIGIAIIIARRRITRRASVLVPSKLALRPVHATEHLAL